MAALKLYFFTAMVLIGLAKLSSGQYMPYYVHPYYNMNNYYNPYPYHYMPYHQNNYGYYPTYQQQHQQESHQQHQEESEQEHQEESHKDIPKPQHVPAKQHQEPPKEQRVWTPWTYAAPAMKGMFHSGGGAY